MYFKIIKYDDTSLNVLWKNTKYAIPIVLTNTSTYACVCWQNIYLEIRSYLGCSYKKKTTRKTLSFQLLRAVSWTWDWHKTYIVFFIIFGWPLASIVGVTGHEKNWKITRNSSLNWKSCHNLYFSDTKLQYVK